MLMLCCSFLCCDGLPGIAWAAHWPAVRTVYPLSQWRREPLHSRTAGRGWNLHCRTRRLHPAWRVWWKQKRHDSCKFHNIIIKPTSYKQRIIIKYNNCLTQWCAGHPLLIHLHCRGRGSSSSLLLELKTAEAGRRLPPDDTKQNGMSESCSTSTNTIWSCVTYLLLLFLFWTAAFTVGAWRYFVSEKEHKDRKRDKRVPCRFAGGWNTAFAQIFQTLNLNYFYRNQDRLDAYPGFISSQASSCPALGASTPVRIFPLSTWMTLTGRSLIWLVSSKGWERKGGKPKQQQKIHIKKKGVISIVEFPLNNFTVWHSPLRQVPEQEQLPLEPRASESIK